MNLPLEVKWQEYIKMNSLARKYETNNNVSFTSSAMAAKMYAEANLFWASAMVEAYGDIFFTWRPDGCEISNGDYYKYDWRV